MKRIITTAAAGVLALGWATASMAEQWDMPLAYPATNFHSETAAAFAAAVMAGSFWAFALTNACFGVHNAFWQYYRFAAADTAPENFRSKAISLTLAGGVVAAPAAVAAGAVVGAGSRRIASLAGRPTGVEEVPRGLRAARRPQRLAAANGRRAAGAVSVFARALLLKASMLTIYDT